MSFIAKGGQTGSIVKDGKEVCQQFEWFCLRHPKLIKMLKSLAESIEKVGERPNTTKKRQVISGAHCPKCGQYIEEGKWYE